MTLVTTPHVQLILDADMVPPPLQAALNRVHARVSVRSLARALSAGIPSSVDVCVILPGAHECPDLLARILSEASEQACATLVLSRDEVGSGVARPVNGPDRHTATADELTGRIKTLCEIRSPMRRLREQLDQLRRRDEQLIAAARERDEQLRLASQIQMDLLPEPLVDADPLSVSTLFLPADHVSGDIYDVARLDEDRFGFSIADATGHGLPAALLTILIKQSFRGKEITDGSYRIIEPDELLSRLNAELLHRTLSQCQFITALHAILDRTSRQVRWARGGSPYPVLLRPGELPRQLRSAGGLIGALPQQTFEVAGIELEPGDTLLLYTDGLEAFLLGRHASCAEGAILESPWLDRVAIDGPDAALDAIREQACRLSTREWPRDDITVIAIKLN